VKDLFTLQDAARLAGPHTFGLMLKPAGSACNLSCTYCYYLDKGVRQPGGVMSPELLEECIRQYAEACEGEELNFCWHGGEPLLLGIGFFRKALEMQKRYCGGRKICNSLQTNGLLVNTEWCRFFANNGFLIGISLDGPRDIHDAFRVNGRGKPSFDKVMEAVRLFRAYGVEFNTLSVVNSHCEGRGAEIYRFLRDTVKSTHMQFLPAVEMLDKSSEGRPRIAEPGDPSAQVAPWSVSPEGYGRFLCDIFDVWVKTDVGSTFVQMFDATLAGWCGVPPGVCTMAETCGGNLCIERGGDVYACDHLVYPSYLLGNVLEKPLKEIFDSPARVRFALNKRNGLPEECLVCPWYRACHGECPQHRFSPKNYLCEGLRLFFAHVAPSMDIMSSLLERELPPSLIMQNRYLFGIF